MSFDEQLGSQGKNAMNKRTQRILDMEFVEGDPLDNTKARDYANLAKQAIVEAVNRRDVLDAD